MIILRHFHFKMLPEIHFNVLHADSFFRILFCHHNQITAISSQHPITGQPNASCLISNIICTYWLQAPTVWIQIRLQVFFSKIVSIIRKYHNHKDEDKPMAPRGGATQPSRDTRKTNKAKQPALSSDPDRVDISSFRSTTRLFADRPSIGLFFILRGKHMLNMTST